MARTNVQFLRTAEEQIKGVKDTDAQTRLSEAHGKLLVDVSGLETAGLGDVETIDRELTEFKAQLEEALK